MLQDSGPPVDPMPDQTLPGDIPTHGGGIVRVEFAGDGCRLLTGSTDRTARCLWLPLSKHGGAGTTFVGHNGPVNSICWSHAGEYLLTASADRWVKGIMGSAVCMGHLGCTLSAYYPQGQLRFTGGES